MSIARLLSSDGLIAAASALKWRPWLAAKFRTDRGLPRRHTLLTRKHVNTYVCSSILERLFSPCVAGRKLRDPHSPTRAECGQSWHGDFVCQGLNPKGLGLTRRLSPDRGSRPVCNIPATTNPTVRRTRVHNEATGMSCTTSTHVPDNTQRWTRCSHNNMHDGHLLLRKALM